MSCPLTPKQYDTLLLVMRGMTYQQAARERGVSPSTVRTLLHKARGRLDVDTTMQATAVMLREGWADLDELLPDYTGAPYSTDSQHGKHRWMPSPAQRLYLDAFDGLLGGDRDEDAADVYYRAMCHERGCPDRRGGRAKGRGVMRLFLS